MAEEIYAGNAIIYNDEERREAGERWRQEQGGGNYTPPSGDQGGDGYYDGQMPAVDQPAEPSYQPEQGPEEMAPEPQPSQHWIAQPENFAEVWDKYDADPNYEDEHYSREQIESLYEHYSYVNPGKTMDQWGPLMDNDDYVTKEIERNNWYDPVKEEAIQQAANHNELLDVYNPEDPEKSAFFEQKEMGDWNDLNWVGKLTAAVTTTDNGVLNAPEWTKKTQAAAQALSSAMSGPAALKILGGGLSMAASAGIGGGAVAGAAAALTNPWVLAGAALAVGGLAFYQALTGKEIPVFSKFLELSDLKDTMMEHAAGFGIQTYEMGKGYVQRAAEDPNDAYGFMNAINDTIKEVGEHAGSMWKSGEYTYEMYGSVGDFAIDALQEIFEGKEGTKMGEAWFFNRGINEKQQLAEGTYGTEGMENIREMFEEMDALGVDKDLQQSIMQQAVINVSGSSGNVSDYVAQMLLDLDILTTPIENEAMGLMSRITHDENGMLATQQNRGNIATQLPFVGSIIQAVTKEKGPGGFNEWMDTRKNIARTTDVSKLNYADRIIGGLDEQGRIKEFLRTDKTGPADLLPESKVAGVGNIANNTLNAYMYDVKDTNDIRNRLASLAGDASPETEYQSGLNNSPEVLTVREGMRHAINETNPEILIKRYESSESLRQTLYKAAEEMGMQVKDVLSLYSENPVGFEQLIKNTAAKNNGMFAGIDVTNGVEPVTTIIKGFTTAKDGKGTPLAWDIRQLQYQITTSMIDSMAKYYTEYYGVKPNSTINTVFDTMKSAQSLLLLGWSPGYFINNVINNTVTSAAEGVLGFMTPKQIQQWMDAFGVTPARFDVDTNADFRSQSVQGKGGLEAFTSAASEAKKANDQGINKALSEVNKVLRNANDKLGVFSRLSGLMETMQGNQLTAVAIQQYWGKRWKRGEGFHLMPTVLVDAIEAQNPGMTNVIYQAVENGMNMQQIYKSLIGTYVKADAGTVMKRVCDQLFRDEASVYEEILEKSGVMNDIREKIANCNTDEERQTVINEAKRKVEDYTERLRREELVQRANNVAATVEAEGLAPVAQMMSEMEMNHQNFWIRIRNEWAEVKQKIQEQNLDGKEAQALQADLVARHNKEFADLYKQEAATAAGIMKGLGFQNENHVKYITLMNENNQNWVDFNDAKGKELQRYFDRRDAIKNAAGKGKKADSVMINEAWEDYNRNVSELYDQHFDREQELQAKMNAAFVEGYEFATQKSGDELRQNFQRIMEIRQRMHDMQQDAHRQTSKMTRDEQIEFYKDFSPKYNALIREIGNLGDANAKIIDDHNDGHSYENHAPVNMTPEQTVQAEQVMETNNVQREKAMRERQGYLDREEFRQGWIDAGRTPAEADLIMVIADARAEQWAKDNGAYPDEFYSQAAQLKGIAAWMGDDYKDLNANILKQSSEEFWKSELGQKLIAKTLTPEFTAWFRNSKRKDEAGRPQHIYHGSPAIFFKFLKEKAGSKTGRNDTKDVFYYVKERGTARTYAGSSEPIWHRIGERFYAYIEGRIVPGGETNLTEQTTLSSLSSPNISDVKKVYNAFSDLILLLSEYPIAERIKTDIGLEVEDVKANLQSIIDKGTLSQSDIEYVRTAYFLDDSIRYAFGDTNTDSSIDNKYKGSGIVYEGYLRQENPMTVDYSSQEHVQFMLDHEQMKDTNGNTIPGKMTEEYAEKHKNGWDESWQLHINELARSTGHDGVEYLNVYDTDNGERILTSTYTTFEANQFKSIWNDGSFNNADNFLHQNLQEIVKGTFEHTDVGNIIRMLEASDVSTMVHESGHLFRRTLSTPLLQEFTKWAGFESVAEFQELEVRFWKNDPTLTEAEKARYNDAEEKFARGFEQYMMDGSAPTPALKAVFKAFRDYLLDIYKNVKQAVTGNDYSQQGEFVFHGANGDEVLNINATINGVKLRDIFDRMLTDDVQRIPGYQELVQNLRTKLGQDRHNMRMSDKALSRRAQIEVTRAILQNFGSIDAAEDALHNYDLPLEINGWKVDDGTLYEAINAAKADPQMNPFSDAERHEVKGSQTYGYSIKYSGEGKKYQLQYKVVELDDLMPSNEWMGDRLVINENYPADLQARNRQADQSDVYAHAANLNPGLLIDEQRAIDSGAPIVGEGNMVVESGNGRVLSLLYAKDKFPEQWQNYQEYLRNSVGDYGIDPADLDSFDNPVLIRERLGDDAITFAEDANSNRNKGMTASENALTDANKMNMNTLGNLNITPGEGVDTFTTEKNAQPAVEWLRSLPETERNKYSTTNRAGDLILSVEGKDRFINALFATIYATPESLDIIQSFTETADSNIQAVESALKGTLPEMARAEGLIRGGSRAAELSITADLMAAAGLLRDARKASMNIHDYLAQAVIPGMERWTPTQALLAGFLGDAKNNVRMIKDFLNAYGEEVYKAGDPNQLSLFSESKTREQMINDSLNEALNRRSREVTNPESGIPKPAASNQQPAASGEQGPRLNQSVLDSDGRWTSEFAKVLDENMQRTFDDGMSIPLDQADSVFLQGDVNVKYETMVQRWLRDFSNNKNLSSDQYLYAWDYLEWWVKGSNGEAPKGNPIWESNIQQMVMKDFVNEHSQMISELKRRNTAGAEVDSTAVPNKGEYVKRVYGFEHGFWNIAGNVYKDGKLVAYLPEELSKMKRTIDVDGQSYKVLGVDPRNPEGLVYYDPTVEIVRTVIAGKPEGFDEPRNAFAFMKPSRQGTTPQTMPVADAYQEIASKYLLPALNQFGDEYKKADLEAQTAQMSGLDLQTRAQIMQWLDQDVSEDMRTEKYRAVKYSDTKKDAAMLNYNQRYGFDPILMILSPYQFWYTRSMWKWAKRMIDKPALGNAYQRMQEYEDKNRQENLPSRLSGKWRIPMPFLPDWMGGSYYVDLNAQLFPFAQFGQSYGSNMNYATLNARTESILNEMRDADQISPEQMQEALTSKKGAIWDTAYAQAEAEIGRNDQLSTLASQFFSPNIFWTWATKKQEGEDPGTLSGTRTGNAIKALTGDIPLVSKIGSLVGDAMTLPERALRKLYGFDYNEFGAYGDQQIRKQISQMCADGEINHRQALDAMSAGKGTIWDMAADRQRQEAMMKVPGFAGAQAAKEFAKGNASLPETLGAMAVSTLGGGSIFPTGEEQLRTEKASKDQAYLLQAAGDKDAVSRWYDEHPDYVTRSATYMDDPEELLKYTLYNHITEIYYDQPYARQIDLQKQLGPEFYNALFNKETKNYKAVPLEKLAEWNARIGGTTPDVGSIDVQGVERVMRLSDQVVDVVAQHDEIMNTRFPGIKIAQDGYYAVPKDQRKAYLQQFPKLTEYWDWNREYKKQYPEYAQWDKSRSDMYNERTMCNAYADMSERTQKELEYAMATGKQMSDVARYELERLYQKYADPGYTSYGKFVQQLMDWE